MAYKDITAGTKTAKPIAARFITSKNGNHALEVCFQFEETSTHTQERLYWQGWLSQKALENTMKTLVEVLGFNGNDSVDSNGVLTDPDALSYGKDVSIVVEMESYTTDDGQTKQAPKIKWVNKLSGSSFSGCNPEIIKNDLNAVGFKAAFLAAKQKAPATSPSAQPQAKAGSVFDESKMPW